MNIEQQLKAAIAAAPTPAMADRLRAMLEREKNAQPGATPAGE